MMHDHICADWPAPPNIQAGCTTRIGGFSERPYASFNLAQHVGDNEQHVEDNRRFLCDTWQLPAEPLWLEQTHSNRVYLADENKTLRGKPRGMSDNNTLSRQADAIISRQSNTVCAILTADCLPLLICDKQGKEIAAIHAGWRGLANGVIENTLRQLRSRNEDLLVWLGPAIGATVYEVGTEVYETFCRLSADSEQAFQTVDKDHYLADLYQLARLILQGQHIHTIYGGNYCTYSDAKRFYSYRRDGQTGRMASLIWIENSDSKK